MILNLDLITPGSGHFSKLKFDCYEDVYDSLGEAYKTAGDNKNSIKNLRKSLTLNPASNVKANSIKLLKELGVSDEGK